MENGIDSESFIYHYCSVESMMSILRNKCIWLNDSSKTNDSTEIIWVLKNLIEVLTENLEKERLYIQSSLFEKIKAVIDAIEEEQKTSPSTFLTKILLDNQKNFLACFSVNGDLLSQWRAYANDGTGVSIGFDSNYFRYFNRKTNYSFKQVNYLDRTKAKMHELFDDLFKQFIQDCVVLNSIEDGFLDLKTKIYWLINSVRKEGHAFKNQHFSEEKEWRINRVVERYDDCDGTDEYAYNEFLEGAFSENSQYLGDFTCSQLKFRAINDDIKCYFELGFGKLKSKIIRRIILGPKCKIKPFDLKIFLADNKYIEDIYDKSITIMPSYIPYI